MSRKPESGTGGSGKRRGGRKGRKGMWVMVSGGSPEEGIPDGPWAPLRGEEDPYESEGQDEEATPLLNPETEAAEMESSNPFLKGLWNDLNCNPFNKDVWMPSWDPLATRDNAEVEFEHTDLLLHVPIKHSCDFPKRASPVSLLKPEEVKFEPSHSLLF